MNKLTALFASILAALLLTACGDGGGNSFVGSWQVDPASMRTAMDASMAEDEPEADLPPEAAQMRDQMIENMIADMKMDLTISEDNTFTMVMTMMGDPQTRTGQWSISGNTITMSDDQGETVTGRVVDGSLIVEGDGSSGGPEELRFVRAAE